ncbi:MAG: ATP-binding SpoIIE family protein phosphatase [Actinomycetota bacterium]
MRQGEGLGPWNAVVDAVEEAIVFSDVDGIVRLINRRAAMIFGIDPDTHLDAPAVQLARVVALQTEDPEGLMESLQEVRSDPEVELTLEIEQLSPERRLLDALFRPAYGQDGELLGRIAVFSDVTEIRRRIAENKRLLDEARKTAESYQRALLPENPPSLPRVGLVAHYIAAAGRRAVCGDFYDFISLPDGRVAVVIGDVCGVGPPAVTDAALARFSLASLLRSEEHADRLLESTNVLIRRNLGSERFVRMVVAVLDPERAVLEYSNAGHVPPIIYHCGTNSLEWLGEGGLPVGVEEDARYKSERIELQPGDMVLFYTDGVTEATRRGRPLGQGRLSDLILEYGFGTPGELVQAIRRNVEVWTDGELRDDIAMVGVQVVPDSSAHEASRELVVPNEPSRMREVRHFVSDFLADLRAPVDVSTEILLAAGEAAGNAVKYGHRPKARSELRIRCTLEGVDVVVTIVDDGPGFDVAEASMPPDPFASGGRGLFLMNRLMDEVDIDASPVGTSVKMKRRTFKESPLPG